MCGLFGHYIPDVTEVMTNEQYLIMTAFLAHSMDTRGGDSFGVAEWAPNSVWTKPRIQKGLGTMGDRVIKLFSGTAPAIFRLGHTRKATVGAVVAANSHPFVVKDVIGCHNGSVWNHTDLAKEWKAKWEVDSQAIFHAIAHNKDLADIKAYGAITYVRGLDPNKIYLGRFNNGQLSIAGLGTSKDTKGVVWASTTDALIKALKTAGLPYFLYESAEGALYSIEYGHLCREYEDGEQATIPISKNTYSATDYIQRGGYRPPVSSTPKADDPHIRLADITQWDYTRIPQIVATRGKKCEICTNDWTVVCAADCLILCDVCFRKFAKGVQGISTSCLYIDKARLEAMSQQDLRALQDVYKTWRTDATTTLSEVVH